MFFSPNSISNNKRLSDFRFSVGGVIRCLSHVSLSASSIFSFYWSSLSLPCLFSKYLLMLGRITLIHRIIRRRDDLSFSSPLINFLKGSLTIIECGTILYGISTSVFGDTRFASSTLFFRFASYLNLRVHGTRKSSHNWNLQVFQISR